MIISMVHDLPSIDDYDQVMISRFATLEVGSPLFSRCPYFSIFASVRSMVQTSPLINGCDQVRILVSQLWESPYFCFSDIQDRDGARSTVQIFLDPTAQIKLGFHLSLLYLLWSPFDT
jgi:hypothetical protein